MKLEVGMYVRTKDGKIAKFIKYDEKDKEELVTDYYEYSTIWIKDVIKASHNIIDLIEENDLLEIRYLIKPNEYQREALQVIKNYTGKLYVNAFPRKIFIEDFNSYGVEILSVETKEQFESMSYKLGE